jgi:hypothetical protein
MGRPVLAGTVVALAMTCALPSLALAQGQAAGASTVKRMVKGKDAPSTTKASFKSRNSGAVGTTPGKPNLVGTYADWGTYLSQGAKSKICYALGQPKDRSPSSLKRESAYVFISSRPGEGVRNEVSIIMGVPLKDGANGGKAQVGSASFELVAKGQNAFIKNAAEEGQFVESLRKRGSRLVIKIPTSKGAVVADTYSLSGVSQALDRVAKECQ